MRSRQLTEQDQQALRELAKQWGRIVAGRAFGAEGPGLDVTFAEMEAIAVTAARGLTEGTLAQLLEQQGQKLGPTVACPECGTPCAVEPESRTLVVHDGVEVDHAEPACECRRCRRSFFPSAADVGIGSSGLQPVSAGQDRDGGGGAQVVCDGGEGTGSAGRSEDQ